jgi:hypothetical protein
MSQCFQYHLISNANPVVEIKAELSYPNPEFNQIQSTNIQFFQSQCPVFPVFSNATPVLELESKVWNI